MKINLSIDTWSLSLCWILRGIYIVSSWHTVYWEALECSVDDKLTTKSRWWALAAADTRRWQPAASLRHHSPHTLSMPITTLKKSTHEKNIPYSNMTVLFFSLFENVRFWKEYRISRRVERGSLSVGDRGADWRSPEPTPPQAQRKTIFALFWLRF